LKPCDKIMKESKADLEGDENIEDVYYEEEESDPDYEPPIPEVIMNDVMDGMRNIQLFMTQKFDAQDIHFREINKGLMLRTSNFRR